HRYVDDRDIRARLANELERAESACGLANQLEVVFRPHQVAQTVEHARMVVGQHDAGFSGHDAALWLSRVMRANSAVPAPGVDSISSVPPISNSRSRMPSSPRP